MGMEFEKSCGAVIYKDDGGTYSFLIVHMRLGHWSFPKGHVESGESEAMTAIREIKEETNLEVTLMKGFRKTVEYSPKPNVIKEVVYFIGTPKTNEIICQENEVVAAGWYRFDAAKALLTYQNDRNILCLANHYLQII